MDGLLIFHEAKIIYNLHTYKTIKKRFYLLFIFRKRGNEGDKEGEKH